MAEVTSNGRTFTTYASLAEADDYLGGSLTAATWGAMSEDDRSVRLVEATRLLDRQSWRPAYRTFEARAGVAVIVTASIEIAGSMSGDGDASILEGAAQQAVKRSRVGPVEEEYFRSFDAASPLPSRLMAMLAGYLATGTGRAIGGVIATGLDGVSYATDPYGFTRGV